jgi:hypothetical protein
MHLNWVFPVASSLLPASFEEFRHPNLNAEQLIAIITGMGSARNNINVCPLFNL